MLAGGEAAGSSSTGACGCAAIFFVTSGPSAATLDDTAEGASAGVLTSEAGGLAATAAGGAVAVAGSAATGSCATDWLSVTAGAATEVLSFDEAGDDATEAASTGADATAGTE